MRRQLLVVFGLALAGPIQSLDSPFGAHYARTFQEENYVCDAEEEFVAKVNTRATRMCLSRARPCLKSAPLSVCRSGRKIAAASTATSLV